MPHEEPQNDPAQPTTKEPAANGQEGPSAAIPAADEVWRRRAEDMENMLRLAISMLVGKEKKTDQGRLVGKCRRLANDYYQALADLARAHARIQELCQREKGGRP
jgi:hypothetical protein